MFLAVEKTILGHVFNNMSFKELNKLMPHLCSIGNARNAIVWHA